jgi:hypothetical protein
MVGVYGIHVPVSINGCWEYRFVERYSLCSSPPSGILAIQREFHAHTWMSWNKTNRIRLR